MYAIVGASSLLAVLLVLAWAREFRLRRALQSLLARIFTFWRNTHGEEPTHQESDTDSSVDPARNDRM